MTTTTRRLPEIQFRTGAGVPAPDRERAAEIVTRALGHVAEPVLWVRVTLAHLGDPAVPRPDVVTVQVDLNGRPVHTHAASTSIVEAAHIAADRLRLRLERQPAARRH